jgi:hypothetical protein
MKIRFEKLDRTQIILSIVVLSFWVVGYVLFHFIAKFW